MEPVFTIEKVLRRRMRQERIIFISICALIVGVAIFVKFPRQEVAAQAASQAVIQGEPWWLSESPKKTHVVRDGDRLWNLHRKLQIKQPRSEWIEDTKEHNPGLVPEEMLPGQKLVYEDKGYWPLDM